MAKDSILRPSTVSFLSKAVELYFHSRTTHFFPFRNLNLKHLYLTFNRRHKRRKENMPKPRRLRSYPDVSDYRDTFKQPQNVRPRSSKRPPPSARDPNPPPMTFSTNQREEFRTPKETGRPPDYAPVGCFKVQTCIRCFRTETEWLLVPLNNQ